MTFTGLIVFVPARVGRAVVCGLIEPSTLKAQIERHGLNLVDGRDIPSSPSCETACAKLSSMSVKTSLAGQLAGQVMSQVPKVAPIVAGGTIDAMMNQAIGGVAKLPGAVDASKWYLKHSHDDPELAIRRLRVDHVAMASAQGFLTNLGGIVTALVAIPANFAGLLTVEAHMVACIAHLRGYDVDDPRTRCAITMCLLGGGGVDEMIKRGDLPTTPLGVATAPVADKALQRQIGARVFEALLSGVGGKRMIAFLGKRVPVIGGAVGLANDGFVTAQVARYASSQFVTRHRAVSVVEFDDEDDEEAS